MGAFGLLDALVSAVITALRDAGRRPADVLAEASAALGLTFEPPEGGTLPRASGVVEGRRVVIDTDGASGGYVVEVSTGHPVTVRARSWQDGATTGVGTGDAAFDARVVLESATGGHRRHSAEGRWASSLDPALRGELRTLVARGAVHEHGRWTVPLGLGGGAAAVVAQVRTALRTAERTRVPDPVASLRERAASDPSDGVRALAADRLVTWLAAQPTRDDALLVALERELPSDLARARIARLRGWVGAATLRSLLGSPDPAVAVEAALGLDAVGERAEPELLAVLPHGDVRVVEALAISGTVASVPALRALTGDAALLAASRSAVRAIQARATGDAGGLSLAAPGAAGALSVGAPDGSGRLTPTDEA
jgi:hypothetical protein